MGRNKTIKTLKITPIKTKIFRLGDNFNDFLVASLRSTTITENTIVVITSKIVSLHESRVISKNDIKKSDLVKNESDYYLGPVAYGCHLTIKNGLLIPSAGVDESNSIYNDYILYPKDPFVSARTIYSFIKRKWQLNRLGVLITDSHTLPLRQGVTGIALAYWGFHGVQSFIGKKDLFGKKLKMTKIDIVDGLASASVLMMGEAAESCPLAVIENAPVKFCNKINPREIRVSPKKDLYYPLYQRRIF